MIALTFDDGPSKKTTPTVLAALKKHNVRATFFTVGENAEKNPALLKEIYEAGHEIGNHTYSHPNLRSLSLEKIKEELSRTDRAIKNATGFTPIIVRAPGGRVSSSVESADTRPFISWTVDTLDWKHRDTERIIAFIETAPLKDGDIILMHDIHKTSAAAVDRVVEILKERGFELVTVSELMLFRGE